MQLAKSLIIFLLFNLKYNDTSGLPDFINDISSLFISDKSELNKQSNEHLIDNQKTMKFHHFRTRKIYEFLYEICKNNPDNPDGIFPLVLGNIIGEYEETIPIEIDYHHVMSKLDSLGEYKRDLDPKNEQFLNNLYLIIKMKMDEFPSDDIFWADLAGLLFKIIFDLKRKMIGAFNSEFKMTSKIIFSINSIIERKYHRVITFDFKASFNLRKIDTCDFNFDFLNNEFFEHSDHLAITFAAALEYAYSPLFILNENMIEGYKGKIPDFDCNKFKMEFFNNGNPDTDMLLKIFMIGYDNKGNLIRDCLEYNSSSSDSTITKELIKEIKSDIDGLVSRGVEHFIGIPNMKYANHSIINFILSNKTILIRDKNNLYWILRIMKKTGLLNRENLESIIRFKENNCKWNQNTFEEYLIECRISFIFITKEELDFFNECLRLFKLKPFERSIKQFLDDRQCLIS